MYSGDDSSNVARIEMYRYVTFMMATALLSLHEHITVISYLESSLTTHPHVSTTATPKFF